MVTLGEVIDIAKTPECLGVSDRAKIVTYVRRAVSALYHKAKWDVSLATVDVSSYGGLVTLPPDVGSIEGVTVDGTASVIRNDWYEYNINNGGKGGNYSHGYVDDKGFSPVFRQLTDYRYFIAVGGASDTAKYIQVIGRNVNPITKQLQVVKSVNPATGQIEEGLFIKIGTSTEIAAHTIVNVQLCYVDRVIKPKTTDAVQLLAFTGVSGQEMITVGYYEPHETNPQYRMIKTKDTNGTKCSCIRIKYKKPLDAWRYTYDYDIIPVPHLEIIVCMIRAIRKYDTSDYEAGAAEELRATAMMTDYDNANKQSSFSLQVPKGFGAGTIYFG